MSLRPLKSVEEDSTANNNFKCPYCPHDFENNMTLELLKLHVKRVHRISCVESFACPKCMQQIFDPTAKDADNSAKENVDHNITNQGTILVIRNFLYIHIIT